MIPLSRLQEPKKVKTLSIIWWYMNAAECVGVCIHVVSKYMLVHFCGRGWKAAKYSAGNIVITRVLCIVWNANRRVLLWLCTYEKKATNIRNPYTYTQMRQQNAVRLIFHFIHSEAVLAFHFITFFCVFHSLLLVFRVCIVH